MSRLAFACRDCEYQTPNRDRAAASRDTPPAINATTSGSALFSRPCVATDDAAVAEPTVLICVVAAEIRSYKAPLSILLLQIALVDCRRASLGSTRPKVLNRPPHFRSSR